MALTFAISIFRAKCDGAWHNESDKAVNVQARTQSAASAKLAGLGWGFDRAGTLLLCPACLDEDRHTA